MRQFPTIARTCFLTALIACSLPDLVKAQTPTISEKAAIAALGEEKGEDLAELVDKVAARIPFLNTNHVLYDRLMGRRERGLLSDNEHEAVQAFRRLAESNADENWLPLLNHNHAKVRTLAMSALYLRGDPKWLPKFVDMSTDTGKTFPSLQLRVAPTFSMFNGRDRTAEEKRKDESFGDQTVGGFAKAIVLHYTVKAGYFRIEGTDTKPGFYAYWKKRKDREHCLSWFTVALARASQNSSSSPGREGHFKKLRSEINSVAPPYRDYILFALGTSDKCGCEKLVPPDELTLVAKRLGADRMMDLLCGKSPTDDPDFVIVIGVQNDFSYRRAARYILQHPIKLLRPSDADKLLSIENKHWERNRNGSVYFPDSRWATAAADLKPAQAKGILLAAFTRFNSGTGWFDQDRRVRLAQSLWKHDGMNSAAFITDWFFGEKTERGAIGFGRHRFADYLGTKENKPLLAKIINDKRLPNIEWGTLQRLVRSLNNVSDEEVISEDEMRKASHPLGVGHYNTNQAKARQQYPKETAELESQLAKWRGKMKAAVK